MLPTVKIMLFLTIAQFLAAGCAANTAMMPFETVGKTWPEAPEPGRIAFVGEFNRSSDLGITPGFWGKLVSFTTGARHDALVRPMAVAATGDNRVIFVADPGARCVHRYDLQRGRYTCLMLARGVRLVSPVGITITGDNRILVSDSQLGRLFQADIDGKRLEPFDVAFELQQPTGIFWDDNSNHVFVTDTGGQSIKVFDLQGGLVDKFSERGALPGQVNYPTYLWMDENNELLVTDSLNFRIQRLDQHGNPLGSFGKNGDSPGSLARPKGVATDDLGHIYVIDAVFHALQVFDRQGDLLLSIGELGQQPGQFWLPNGLFISADNSIYVADAHNKRVQVFRYVGPET